MSIGIATAGWVDPARGDVVYATENLPGWTGTRIGREIEAASGLPVAVENDANALAVGEKHFGAAREAEDFVCITLGTMPRPMTKKMNPKNTRIQKIWLA